MPAPGPGEVLIRVRAIGVNPADGKWREGMFKERIALTLPHIGGYDVAGEIAAGALPAGARVAAMLDPIRAGAYAEYSVATLDRIAILPDTLDFAMAAAAPTPGLTGVQIIEEALDVQPGYRVLITGAVGIVGRFAVHAAKARGAHVIAAVRASATAEAKSIGADETIALDGAPYAGATFDRIADTIGGAVVAPLCRHVGAGAIIKTAATTPIPADGVPVPITFYPVHADAARLARLLGAMASGGMRIPIAARLPLADAAEAQRRVAAGGLGGKIILES